jgi:hypothetical protein
MQGMSSLLALPLLRTEEPETVLYNGNIWTVDETQPRAQAVAISGKRFVAVGSNTEILPLASARTRKIDLAFKRYFQDSTMLTPIRWRQVSNICTK